MDDRNDLETMLAAYDIKPPVCGARCGPGWHSLIEALIKDLIALGWNRDCHQIKEKFSGLRFYIGDGSKEMYELINAAEHESLHICEQCGKPGKRVDFGGWIKTLCTEHAADLHTRYS